MDEGDPDDHIDHPVFEDGIGRDPTTDIIIYRELDQVWSYRGDRRQQDR